MRAAKQRIGARFVQQLNRSQYFSDKEFTRVRVASPLGVSWEQGRIDSTLSPTPAISIKRYLNRKVLNPEQQSKPPRPLNLELKCSVSREVSTSQVFRLQ
ncbi:hypothetical protein NIES2109_55440 (plasmid) [Nostoc sp. HK-01]|nr:hypothetical protein NIES2109_55440 [Nostoc sp. HK-01]